MNTYSKQISSPSIFLNNIYTNNITKTGLDSPQAYCIALKDQKQTRRRQYSDYACDHIAKHYYSNQKSLIQYSPYDVSIQKQQVIIEAPIHVQKSISIINSSQYLQETSDKTQRDYDQEKSLSGLIKLLESQQCFEYVKQVKTLMRDVKRLQEDNKKLRKRQHEVISLLSSGGNGFQSPNREYSSAQVQKGVLSSAKNFVDDKEESMKKSQHQEDLLRKNLFQTFDSASQISPIQIRQQQSQLKSPDSCFSNPFSQTSISDEGNKENTNQMNAINQQQIPIKIIENNYVQKKTISNKNAHQTGKQQIKKKSLTPQNGLKPLPKKIIQIDLSQQNKSQNTQNKKISQILAHQTHSTTQQSNASAEFGRKTASFLDYNIISNQNHLMTKPAYQTHKQMIKPFNGMKDSLKIYKKTYCKSNSPQRIRTKSFGSKSQPRRPQNY